MLLTAGLVPITRNFRCAGGEIDLVMSDGATLVFVEVRSRRDARGGTATASITRSKQQRLLRAAAVYLCRYPHWNECDIRFDLVTFDGMPPALRWHHAVITEDSDGYADE